MVQRIILSRYTFPFKKKLEHIGSKAKISVVRRVGYQLEAGE
jgi:hypothetical protein